MLWTKIKRVLQSGFVNFWRSGTVSLSSVLVMMVALFVLGSIIFIGATLTNILNQVKDKVDINIYFVPNTDESDIMALQHTLSAMPEVKNVEYTSQDAALAAFKDRHQNNQLLLQSLSELDSNPLGAVLNVRAKDPSQYEGIATFLQDKSPLAGDGTSIIESVSYFNRKDAIDRLTNIIVAGQKLGLILIIVLVLVSVLITFNTIRLVIFMSRDEIAVMRLVGASNMYIRGPFVVTGIMYGLVAGVIVIILFYPASYYLHAYAGTFFAGIDLFAYYLHNFGQIAAIVLGSGILIGGVSSYLAVKRYLKI